MTATTRWAAMALQLAGLKLPTPPRLPGRRHECRDEALALHDTELAEMTPTELVRLHCGRSLAWAQNEIDAARERLTQPND